MSEDATSPTVWWRARRLRYNFALLVAGLVAFVAYVVVGYTLLPGNAEFEVTIFTAVFQSLGFLFVMGLANLFYFLGPLSERILRPRNPERYRTICFRLGFWMSVALPFDVPALLAISAVSSPSNPNP